MTINRPFALAALGIALIAPAVARAGDTAELSVLGYSKDGSVFAFEQHGIGDGSGFPYSEIYFIDVKQDKFLPGTPIKVRLEEEMAISKARKEALSKAAPLIEKYALADDPGILAAYNPISEYDSDPHSLRYFPYPTSPPVSQSYTLKLEEKLFPPTPECLNMVGEYTGFTLRLTEEQGAPVDRVIHADGQVPASRHCPNGYRIGAVISSEYGNGPQVAMIVVSTFGFEGNDQRWLAVPLHATGEP